MARKDERCERCGGEDRVERKRDSEGIERTLCAQCWADPLFTLGPAAIRATGLRKT